METAESSLCYPLERQLKHSLRTRSKARADDSESGPNQVRQDTIEGHHLSFLDDTTDTEVMR